MLKADVVQFFGTQKAVADVLGISEAAVSAWKEHVPQGRAFQFEILTGGGLKANPSFYCQRRPTVNQA